MAAATMRIPWAQAAYVLLAAALTCGCAGRPRVPEGALALPASSLEIRSVQSRRFSAASEAEFLQASVAVLQDMEYNLDEISTALGVLSASKVTDADSAFEQTALIALDLLCVLSSGGSCNALAGAADEQKILLTLVVQPSLSRQDSYVARVTLQRLVYDKQARIRLKEQIDDPQVYQEIFANLSRSLMLEEIK
jgi:hypothetical protein